ncbi:uncharacterized protein LOC122075428 [Macadamia integrifolia]|uniref:uncharacterized protein LOC122075428 n=1 Tax=Macadamia integrifolia TaxID=60698 RepID=UPI001C4F043F|nr:uncharacterized protein LOC122075428 [Macadamia integrifolia]XP_042496389.1 uncharacterized protein LOC122075428 [Macadamia integrifolia]XP_042496390.1 uncharacterized protein LOC122075428 [Macadamia integrifolia]
MAPGYSNSGDKVPTHQNPRPLISSPTPSARGDDPLPAIEGLQVSGEAFPGKVLHACGFSTNGTTACYFAWLRCSEDGSVDYIEGSNEPTYMVTAHDVDSYLAVEAQPMDNRGRKGETVRAFANEQRKITYDFGASVDPEILAASFEIVHGIERKKAVSRI